MTEIDLQWMKHAIGLANLAKQQNEVPVGAVLVAENKILGEGFNQPIQKHDVSAHAEIVALRAAGAKLQNYRLVNSTLYVTLEPCIMCLGAIIHARVARVIFGAADPKTGALMSAFCLSDSPKFNHKISFAGPAMPEECGQLLKDFFKERRG